MKAINPDTQPTGGWQAVDSAQDPLDFTGYLEKVSEHPNIRERSRARLSAAGIRPGATVLDLGCGIGSNTLMLAGHVGPSGRVHALDRSRTMLDITARRAAARGLVVTCHQGDAASLTFPNASLDAVWIERVLLHVPSPTAVMAEIRRVLKPPGQLVAAEPDNACASFCDGGDPEIARLLEGGWVDGIAHPRMGSALEQLARAAGFTKVRVETDTVLLRDYDLASAVFRWDDQLRSLVAEGRIGRDRADAWARDVRKQARAGHVICSADLFDLFARP
jgi:ubiquinone/menaquinone biosynthesis C-methylase UbiE